MFLLHCSFPQIARLLRVRGLPLPRCLFLSGCPPSDAGWGDTGVSAKTDEGIGNYLTWLGGEGLGEGGREGGRKGGREGGREGSREGGRDGGREGGREEGTEGGREVN
jgi:hypothetical protein